MLSSVAKTKLKTLAWSST